MAEFTQAQLLEKIRAVEPSSFDALALAIFRYQAEHNSLYAKYLKLLGRRPQAISSPAEIPFLPIQLFKKYTVKTGRWAAQTQFQSSGTTGQTPSRHFVRDLDFYWENTVRGFAQFYGDPAEWAVLALLPSYLERGGSSLVAMAEHFIGRSKHPASGFFLNDFGELARRLNACQSANCPTLLLGVSFALLDFCAAGLAVFEHETEEQRAWLSQKLVVMETGGMKGRRREMTRPELHEVLKTGLGVPKIHSEYGMTELFSQAYALGDGVFRPAPTLQAMAFEVNDPFCPTAPGRAGVLNFMDLANLDSCSFIATEDVGRVHLDSSFEVLGRLDSAELRGCNLMVE